MTVPADQRVAQLVGVRRWRDSPASYYTAANVADFQYPSPLTTAVVVAVAGPILSGSVYALFRTNQTTIGGGWHVQYRDGAWACYVSDGGSESRLNLVTPLVPGTCAVIMQSHDGVTHRAAASIGGTASAAYAASVVGTDPARIGSRSGSALNEARPFMVSAALGTGSQALSAADLLTTINELVDNAEQGRDLSSGLSVFVPEDYLDLADAWQGPGAPLKPTLTARIGGSTFTKTGEPEAAGFAARF